MIRSFIAIELPDDVKNEIGKISNRLKGEIPGVKWVKSANIHLTIRFLGSVTPSKIEEIKNNLPDYLTDVFPFELYLKGAGAFPNTKRARVIWMGLGGDMQPLRHLYEKVSRFLMKLGFPSENRLFSPHLTMGRIKNKIPQKIIEKSLNSLVGYKGRNFGVNELVLFKSELRPEGARYTPLKKWSLD